jgi:hypothetical protein
LSQDITWIKNVGYVDTLIGNPVAMPLGIMITLTSDVFRRGRITDSEFLQFLSIHLINKPNPGCAKPVDGCSFCHKNHLQGCHFSFVVHDKSFAEAVPAQTYFLMLLGSRTKPKPVHNQPVAALNKVKLL